VFEITVTPSAMNADTRVLSTKALDELNHVRSKARDDMLKLLDSVVEPAGTKTLPLPVQIASYEA
jgi:hypothetical protein